MKICLINYYLRTNDYPTKYSLAILRLGEYLNSLGLDIDILPIQLTSMSLEETIVSKIKGKYDIIGISNYVWSKDITPKLSKLIKKICNNVNIIIGGPETKFINLEDYDDEIFILGEGEQSLYKTIKYIESGKNDDMFFKNNPNIFDKQHPNAEIIETEIAYINPLFTKFIDIDKDFLYYETSRGCAYNCGYCGFKNREKVANFDLKFVLEEIKRIGLLRFKEVFIVDANLGGTKERAKKILSYFYQFASSVSLTLYLRPEFIDDEMIVLLKNSNLKDVRIGLQTTNENVPSWLRSNSIYHVRHFLPKLSENGIVWKAELIIGLPGDTLQGLKESIDFVENVLKPSEYCCYPLSVIKGTPLYELTLKKDKNLWVETDKLLHAISSSSYTYEELKEMQQYAIARMNSYLDKTKLEENIKKIRKERNSITYKSVE